MATKVVRGKALVAKLRAQKGVRDPEALAASLGRKKKARAAKKAKSKGKAGTARGGSPRSFGTDDATMKRWGDEHYPADSLSDEEREALHSYKHEAFSILNTALRGQSEMFDEDRDQIKTIDGTMKPLPEDVEVVRGVGKGAFPGASTYLDNLPGTVFEDPAFMSTTLKTAAPEDFADYQVEMRLTVPKGTPSRYLENVADLDEQELLLGRGRKFKIQEVNDLPANRHGVRRWGVVAEVLPE